MKQEATILNSCCCARGAALTLTCRTFATWTLRISWKGNADHFGDRHAWRQLFRLCNSVLQKYAATYISMLCSSLCHMRAPLAHTETHTLAARVWWSVMISSDLKLDRDGVVGVGSKVEGLQWSNSCQLLYFNPDTPPPPQADLRLLKNDSHAWAQHTVGTSTHYSQNI